MRSFLAQAVEFSMYVFVMCVASSTIILIIGAIANGILSALGFLHEAGVIEFSQIGKAGERKK
ncbi:MAG: hypothetical protein QW215_02390 [Ignisphaera sp.]